MSDANETAKDAVTCEILTPEQERKWTDTMSMMVWTAPGFTHLLHTLLSTTHKVGGSRYAPVFSRSVGIAATDGKNLIFNPDTFFKEGLPERTYITCHEIAHNVYNDVGLLHRCRMLGKVPMHDGTSLPLDEPTMQKSMDARINPLLDDSKFGKRPTSCGHYDKDVKANDSVLDVYKRYYKEKKQDGDQPGAGDQPGNNPGGFDSVLPPGASTGQNPQEAADQHNPQQWAVAIAAAQIIQQAKSQGKMAASLKRMFQDVLEPEVPWIEHIQTLVKRVTGDGSYDWTQPDPYYGVLDIYQPSPTGSGAGWIVQWADTSGSRGDDELASHMAETAGIMEDVNPKRLTIIFCDAAIGYVDELTDPMDLEHIKARGAGGGGGTSLEPVFDWIAKNGDGDPDLFIGFTDGHVTFPREPQFPVIWASTTDVEYPYGQVVKVNQKGRTP